MKKIILTLAIALLAGTTFSTAQCDEANKATKSIQKVLREQGISTNASVNRIGGTLKSRWNKVVGYSNSLTIGARPLGNVRESGTVLGQTKRTFLVVPTDKNTMEIMLNKTSGRAKTTVTICTSDLRTGRSSSKTNYIFANGNYKKNKKFTVSNVRGKLVTVVIKNNSVGNKFSYNITSKGVGSSSSSNNGSNTSTTTTNPPSSGTSSGSTNPPRASGIKGVGSTRTTTSSSNSGTEKLCDIRLLSRSGTVLPAGPAIMKVTPDSGNVTITINKTDGKARTTVNIYVNNTFRKRMIFENGRDTPTKRETIGGVKNKEVKVEIVNQSVGNRFKYSARIDGKSSGLLNNANRVSGNLLGQTKKTVESKRSCSGKARVIITRTNGNARATVRVWKKNGSSWTALDSKTFETSQPGNKMILNYSTSKEIKVELKNISVGNTFRYTMDVVAMQ